MMHRRRNFALTLMGVTALTLAGCASAPNDAESGGDTITLSYAYFAPAVSFPSVQMAEWARLLTERTDGQVEVDLFYGGTLLGSGDIYEGVSQGVADVGLDSPAYDTSRFPLSSVIAVPLGLSDPVAASHTFLDLLLEFEPEEYDDFQIITAFTTEAAYLQTTKPVTTRDEAKGMTLRGSSATIPVLEQLGISPVGLPMNEVSEQLSTGVIDGYAASREVLKGFGLAEQVSAITDFPLGIGNSFVAVMDQTKFDALPENVKEVILELREEMAEFAGSQHLAEIAESEELAESEGVETVTVAGADAPAWQAILDEQAEAWVRDNAGAPFDARAVLERTRELAAENE